MTNGADREPPQLGGFFVGREKKGDDDQFHTKAQSKTQRRQEVRLCLCVFLCASV